jgi:hypothetical protein
VAELERDLLDLGRRLDWPATPDVAAAVRPRLGERPGLRLRPLALALVVLAVAVIAALAVPQARTSILRFFHIEGVTVERVDRLPPTRPLGRLELGAPVSPAEAERRLGTKVLLPDGERPDATYFDGALGGGGVNLLYGPAAHPRLLVGEFRTGSFDVLKKIVGLGADVDHVSVDGNAGLWIPGPHWNDGTLTIRLESALSRPAALALARTLHR